MSDERAKLAYSVFRGGFRKDADAPPHWDDLPTWVRDAVTVAYLQGKLDGSTKFERTSPVERSLLAGLGIGWTAAAIALFACYAAAVPFPINAVVPFLTGLGVTLFWLNR